MSLREKLLWCALAMSTLLNVGVLLAFPKEEWLAPTPAPAADASADAIDPMVAQMLDAFGSVTTEFRQDGPREVPLARVLANPHAFEGQKLFVNGYFGYRVSAHGRTFLYASTSDAALQMTPNAILLKFPDSVDPSHFDGACEVDGIFHAFPDTAALSGSLEVKRLVLFQLVPRVDGGRNDVDMFEPFRSADFADF